MPVEPAPIDLDVGVIYTHERDYMTRLISSLAASGQGLRQRLLLVDNCSATGVEEWSSIYPETLVLRNESRLGYAPNLNRILSSSTARYVLLLNTDMWFDPAEQTLSKLVQFMDANPECGVSGCRLYHADGSYGYPARRFQTLSTIAARRLGLSRLLQGTVESYLYQHLPVHSTYDCDWLSGCLLMTRRQAAMQIGGLDTGFAKYFEDVDFCLRMSRHGWRVMFHGGTYGWHDEQRASRQLLSIDSWRHLRSYARWLSKWGLDPASEAHAASSLRRAA